ncbi:MFS general substrate transporter [Dothidotthia symphoricarpi CBS 119687]|uniref:MFS general substrate transporter n=1 Tax=Dothidotthia symphoricarpi CBS 119687 TaxID=1392245 RepID=A0A6A5ZWX0_9PLEO|nr:MFS general substrate transporter [Dothidotthia symphoricarpi CBS 119687]KAF2123434.1 MFS general substrate transporter [Dothidotthia symphoricarpi CBS 119687]
MSLRDETNVIPLHEPLSSHSNEHESIGREQARRHRESDKDRAFALVGSALLQLPIWGFAMSYGVMQEYYVDHWMLQGDRKLTGIIGTTSNGVMYLSMPFLFALFTSRWARYRQVAAVVGALLACSGFVLSSLSKHVWHLVATQGVLAALGCALIYSPTTLSLGEWFNTENRICNRAIAYGICLSSKNIVGSVCPFIFRGLLDRYGFRTTLSAGYGIPQTYLSEYARNVSALSPTFSTLLLTLINIPGICSSTFFGFLSDNKHFQLSASTVTGISAISSALAAFLFWGLAARGDIALLVLFALTFGFFASGYSATWGGIMKNLEHDAAEENEAIDSGILYGLLNGARGVGYVAGGLVSVPLIKAGSTDSMGHFGYGTTYGPLILFTGLSLAFGGWGLVISPKWKTLLRLPSV